MPRGNAIGSKPLSLLSHLVPNGTQSTETYSRIRLIKSLKGFKKSLPHSVNMCYGDKTMTHICADVLSGCHKCMVALVIIFEVRYNSLRDMRTHLTIVSTTEYELFQSEQQQTNTEMLYVYNSPPSTASSEQIIINSVQRNYVKFCKILKHIPPSMKGSAMWEFIL